VHYPGPFLDSALVPALLHTRRRLSPPLLRIALWRAPLFEPLSLCLSQPALRSQALGFAALSAALLLSPAARADLTTDLLAKSSANKATNDAKRLATSGANFARSRTVTDGTCEFPNNWVGCENAAETGSVKFLSDDLALVRAQLTTGPLTRALLTQRIRRSARACRTTRSAPPRRPAPSLLPLGCERAAALSATKSRVSMQPRSDSLVYSA